MLDDSQVRDFKKQLESDKKAITLLEQQAKLKSKGDSLLYSVPNSKKTPLQAAHPLALIILDKDIGLTYKYDPSTGKSSW